MALTMSVSNVNNVSTKYMIPNEVLDIIIEYRLPNNWFINTPSHKLKYKKVLEDLPNHNYLKIKKFLERVEEEGVPAHFEIPFIEENIRRWVFSYCIDCNCCEKHQQNKPDWSDYINGIVPEDLVPKIQNDCPCMCRQLCRDFCRFQATMQNN